MLLLFQPVTMLAKPPLPLSRPTSSDHPSTASPLQRRMASVASPSTSPMALGFVDIFDVPERLEDQRRHVRSRATISGAAMSSAAVAEGSRSSRRATTAGRRQEVKPLPSPILFDGPARRPYSSVAMMYRPQKSRPATSAGNIPAAGRVSRLPTPEVFNGPSRLRPYNVAAATRGSRGMVSDGLFGVVLRA